LIFLLKFVNLSLRERKLSNNKRRKKEVDELHLPDGYSLEKRKVGGRDYTFLYKEGKVILSLPTEHCPSQKIMEVIQQIKG